MVSFRSRPPLASGAAVAADAAVPHGVPPYLRGLCAVNPNLARDYATDPGFRAFIDANKASLVQWERPPAGAVSDSVTWSTWCHTTTIVPAQVRDEEYIMVVARGSAYENKGAVRIPLHDGTEASSTGRIAWIGKTKDLLHTQQRADEGGHYPGAITVDVTLPVAGKAGEKLELSYARIAPDAQGRAHRSHSGWPDTFKGVAGGFSGRELSLTVAGGRKQVADCPDGCSTRSRATVV